MTIAEVINAINDFAPLSLQESWDNSGVQVGDITAECSGVLLCVDATETIIDEAIARGCNLVIAHHPLLFRGLKQIVGKSLVERTVLKAIRRSITVFSAHTSLDSTRGGISWEMARMLGSEVTGILSPSTSDPSIGLGVIAEFSTPFTPEEFTAKVKQTFGSPICRCTAAPNATIQRIAMCGGAGGEFINEAIAAGAQAYISSDTRYHDFVDHASDIFLVDIGHYESESCAKDIFYRVITEKFPNFAVCKSELEKNPINYL